MEQVVGFAVDPAAQGMLVVLGILASVRIAWWMVVRVTKAMRAPRKARSYGPWVVVTGATDGIGRAMCFEFAKHGMNVMLISRTESKLKETAQAVSSSVGGAIQTKWLSVDFSRFDKPAQERVAKELAALGGVGILINNVGMSYPFPLYFHELSDEEVSGLLELNINATTWMTRVTLPLMLEQKKGLILNIGSAAGLHPSPLLALYSATKAYVETLSHSLNTEYKSKGIDVQAHMPLFVVSKLSKYKKPSGFVPSAEQYAAQTMQTLGLDPVVSPHWPHRVASWVMDVLPTGLVQMLSLRFHLGIRAKGLKKRARESQNPAS